MELPGRICIRLPFANVRNLAKLIDRLVLQIAQASEDARTEQNQVEPVEAPDG